MTLQPPELDDRTYDEILAEVVARIPVHTPEWTNFNDSDPGITLLQLFSFMTDNLLYRCRLVPERNRMKFLQLLGVELQPPAAAKGIVTFSNLRGPQTVNTLEPDLELQAGNVPFRTLGGLDVLPVEGRTYYKAPLAKDRAAAVRAELEEVYADLISDASRLALYETKLLEAPESAPRFPVVDLEADTVDGALWIALMARSEQLVRGTRSAIAGKVLTIGIAPDFTDAGRGLGPGRVATTESGPRLLFQVPVGGSLPDQPPPRTPEYTTLDARVRADVLVEPGLVELPLPPERVLGLWDNLEPDEEGSGEFPPLLEGEDAARVVTWVRFRAKSDAAAGGRAKVAISWVGVNAAQISQRTHVPTELLGRGTGEPDQRVSLTNVPVLTDSVQLTVAGELWAETDHLLAARGEIPARWDGPGEPGLARSGQRSSSKVYTVDRQSGEIRFGAGVRGARPPQGALLQARYDHGGGTRGLVAIGAITKGPALPAGVKVGNPLPTWGGDDGETIAEAEERVPAFVRHRDRMVAPQDFADITWRTPGVQLGRVEVLPLFHPTVPDLDSPGVVTVLVIPRTDLLQPEAPQPDRLFIDTVCSWLDPRRLVTTELHVRGPQYEPIWVGVGIDVTGGRDFAPVRERVKAALRTFLSPLSGGWDEGGWPLGTGVERLELWATATRVEGVGKVNGVVLTDETGVERDRITLEGLELPRLVALAVEAGQPPNIADLVGGIGSGDQVGGDGGPMTPYPVPVVPEEC